MNTWYYEQAGRQNGPVDEAGLRALIANGVLRSDSRVWTEAFGPEWRPLSATTLASGQGAPPPLSGPAYHGPGFRADPQLTVKQIADQETISGALWLALGIFQCIIVVGLIAGIPNIIAGIIRLNAKRRILERDPGVPAEFDSFGGLIALGIVNFIFGGVIGIGIVVFDFFIRDSVLANAALFNGPVHAPPYGAPYPAPHPAYPGPHAAYPGVHPALAPAAPAYPQPLPSQPAPPPPAPGPAASSPLPPQAGPPIPPAP